MTDVDPEIQRVRDQLAAEVARMADEAVELAREVGIELDYGEASMDGVERALATIGEDFEELSERGRDLTVQRFGCYILEVARRAHGGYFQWWPLRDAPVLVLDDQQCHLGLHTWDKVRGRLGGDEGDNLPFFYRGFAEAARERHPGTNRTYV